MVENAQLEFVIFENMVVDNILFLLTLIRFLLFFLRISGNSTPHFPMMLVNPHFLLQLIWNMPRLRDDKVIISGVLLRYGSQNLGQAQQSVANESVVYFVADNNDQSAGASAHSDVNIVLLAIPKSDPFQVFLRSDFLQILCLVLLALLYLFTLLLKLCLFLLLNNILHSFGPLGLFI